MSRRYRYKDIQLPQLRSFCLAATEGNFTAAAKVLGLSPSTVWEQVRSLERRLGASLMIRRGRAVELTREGQLLLDLIQPHVSGLDSIERLFQSSRAALPGRLTIASTPYLLGYHLIEPIRAFSAAPPDVAVNVRASIRLEDVAEQVERGQADLGIVGWDTHKDGFPDTPYLCREVDPAYVTLLRDLHDRGMLENTLVVWMGEFGRTPKFKADGGRDHYANGWLTALAGGGVKGGQVIGATDKDGVEVTERPVGVQDLFVSFCHVLDIDPRAEYTTTDQRPIKLVEGGKVVKELFS